MVPIIRGARACPVEAVSAWLAASGISEGPLFRRMVKGGRAVPGGLSPHSIGATVKRYTALAGFKAAEFGGH
ncbi:MAG: integrase, partial [Nitrospinota bacterium]